MYLSSFAVTERDQVQLGHQTIVAMRVVQIERMLCRLKVPGRIATPAARTFDKMLNDQEDIS